MFGSGHSLLARLQGNPPGPATSDATAYDSCHIIILDRDLLTVLAAQILDPRIMTTIIGGKIVYQRQ